MKKKNALPLWKLSELLDFIGRAALHSKPDNFSNQQYYDIWCNSVRILHDQLALQIEGYSRHRTRADETLSYYRDEEDEAPEMPDHTPGEAWERMMARADNPVNTTPEKSAPFYPSPAFWNYSPISKEETDE